MAFQLILYLTHRIGLSAGELVIVREREGGVEREREREREGERGGGGGGGERERERERGRERREWCSLLQLSFQLSLVKLQQTKSRLLKLHLHNIKQTHH